ASAVPALTAALRNAEPLVRGHAAWALGEIGTTEALSALEQAQKSETDAYVLEEVEAALSRTAA
ncbi:MAG TPA: epoxyqueuosine reductase, partial [Dehalococcoidia bacterium]|nr:epoxyqueuosine reductase [Dehalococcoidia bacterium]